MIEKEVIVTNAKGIHARPSALIAKTAAQFKARMCIMRGDIIADARDVLSILTLCAPQGASVVIQADGPDESAALAALEAVFTTRFDFD